MQVNQDAAIRQYTQVGNYQTASAVASVTASKTDDKKTAEAAASSTQAADTDRVELSQDAKVTTKMSDSERAALVKSLKDDLNNQMSRFTNMMTQMFQKQGITASLANGNDFWRMMASGNFTVDEQTKADAQAAISEDGYWGVSQTSQRIFDFVSALAGDDEATMKKYQEAVEKGFAQAEEAWGGPLPSISGETHEAVNKLFDEYYAKNKTA